MKAFTSLCTTLLLCVRIYAQDTVSVAEKFSSRYIHAVEKKAEKVEEQLTKQSRKALERLQKGQQKAYKALHKMDSGAAATFIQNSRKQYEAALAKLKNTGAKATKFSGSYVPGLDSMTGVLKYLDKLPAANALPGKEKIGDALSAAANAGNVLNQATEIKKLMQQQQQQLKALAAKYKNLKIGRQLKQYNKELYYYSQRVQQAKQTLNDPQKIEGEVLKLLRKNETFKNWMHQNGQLAKLFGSPGNVTTTAQSLAGLPTRQSVQQQLQSRLGGSVQQVQQLMSSQVQQAQEQLTNMRNRLQQKLGKVSSGIGNNGDLAMPDFKPNNQKTKSFLKRLETSWNLQATQRKGRFPAMNELGISVGYKLNDKSIIGIGGAYRFGLGEKISKIKWTHEGMSLRSFVDIKWKGNWWISGGYEQNYWSRFGNNQFSSIVWQQSGLIGLTKKIMVKKGKEMKMQVLYDLLEQHLPGSLPFKFRVGKSL